MLVCDDFKHVYASPDSVLSVLQSITGWAHHCLIPEACTACGVCAGRTLDVDGGWVAPILTLKLGPPFRALQKCLECACGVLL